MLSRQVRIVEVGPQRLKGGSVRSLDWGVRPQPRLGEVSPQPRLGGVRPQPRLGEVSLQPRLGGYVHSLD